MASPNNSLKIHEQCVVAPPSATTTQYSLPLTFLDLFWLRFHPVERIFFYSHQSDPSFFYDTVLPKLKSSLSLTLQHFLPLAGKIVWPSDSHKPIIQYSPGNGEGVPLIIAECSHVDFNEIIDNSPRDAVDSRLLVPHLDSSDSQASVISLQITLFPNRGFCIGISAHHAVLDGKSTIMFIKSWAHLCQTQNTEESSSLLPELAPFFNREVIKDSNDLENLFLYFWTKASSKLDPNNSDERSLNINLPNASQPILEHSARATFELTRGDLEKLRSRVLSKWDTVDIGEQSNSIPSKPITLSTFVLTCAYVSVCIAKAIEESESEKRKFALGFSVDCRARLEPPIPENYFGNCISAQVVDTLAEDFTKEDGLVILAKKIHGKIKNLDKELLEGAKILISKLIERQRTQISKSETMQSEKVKGIGVSGSTRFGVYGVDFGWGRPAKVEITSVDRGITIGMAEGRDGKGGVEVGLVLNNNVMDLFNTYFHAGLCFD